jgi:hypothetical protein
LGTAAPPPNTSLLGGFTLVKREPPKGRSRIKQATGAAAPAGGGEAVVITTRDGAQHMVDGPASIDALPEAYRAEVRAQVEALTRMASLLAARC